MDRSTAQHGETERSEAARGDDDTLPPSTGNHPTSGGLSRP